MVSYTNPTILECAHYVEKQRSKKESAVTRLVRDFEIDFNISGGRIMHLDGKDYPIRSGSVVFRKPGQVASSEGDCNMYMLTLDYSHRIGPCSNIRTHPHQMELDCAPFLLTQLPAYLEPVHSSELLILYRKLAAIYRQPLRSAQTAAVLMQILHLLASDAYAEQDKNIQQSTSDMIISYFNDHYGEKITLQQLADHVHLDKSYLVRKFRSEIGQTPFLFLKQLRLSHARKMLQNTNFAIGEIALQCGFESPSYFSKSFRQVYHLSPPEYRRECFALQQTKP